jgi:hypothetical protein
MFMNKFWIAAMAGCLLTVSAMAQTTPGSAAPANDNHVSLAAGAVLQAELTKSIDAKKAKSGDEIDAKLAQDIKTTDGKILMHRGAKLVGHVTEAQAKSKENAESRLGVVFEKAVAKDGQEITFSGLIQAIAAPAQSAPSLGSDDRGGMGAGSGGGNMGGGRSGGGAMTPMGGGGMGAPGSSNMGSNAGNPANSSSTPANGAGNGSLSASSRGVSGMPGVTLNVATGNSQSSVFSSTNGNIKLESGTQMILQVAGPAGAK